MKKIIVLLMVVAILSSAAYATVETALSDPRGNKTLMLDSNGDSTRMRGNDTGVPGGGLSLGGGIKTITTGGTAEALASSTACRKVMIQAESDNTGVMYIGGSDVDSTTKNGFPLDAGETWIGTVDNLADIYVDATVNGDGVHYSYEA